MVIATSLLFYTCLNIAHLDIEKLYELYLKYPSVQTDTRKLQSGDIYFALKGPNFNGNRFAHDALDKGAVYAIIDEAQYKVSENCILVDDALTTLQDLAKHHRKQFNIPFIAITGSNGKTTTKELITAVLKTSYNTYATVGNLNNHIGVPLTILSIPKSAAIAVIEMGANHQKEIESYCKVALPSHGIITNCGKAHIEGFGGVEGVKKGKGELYDFIRNNDGTIFRNSDLEYLIEMATGIKNQITYGSANAQYIGKPLINDVLIDVAVLTKGAEATIKTQLVGEYNFYNVMAAVAIGLHFDISIDVIKKAISNYQPDNSRSQWLQKGTNKIILDAYNANPTSMRAAIINFARTNLKNKTLWLGGMKEMGDAELQEHKDLLELINEYDWHQVILVGDEFKDISNKYLHFSNSTLAKEYIQNNLPNNTSVLVKGSRGSKMEVMIEALV